MRHVFRSDPTGRSESPDNASGVGGHAAAVETPEQSRASNNHLYFSLVVGILTTLCRTQMPQILCNFFIAFYLLAWAASARAADDFSYDANIYDDIFVDVEEVQTILASGDGFEKLYDEDGDPAELSRRIIAHFNARGFANCEPEVLFTLADLTEYRPDQEKHAFRSLKLPQSKLRYLLYQRLLAENDHRFDKELFEMIVRGSRGVPVDPQVIMEIGLRIAENEDPAYYLRLASLVYEGIYFPYDQQVVDGFLRLARNSGMAVNETLFPRQVEFKQGYKTSFFEGQMVTYALRELLHRNVGEKNAEELANQKMREVGPPLGISP